MKVLKFQDKRDKHHPSFGALGRSLTLMGSSGLGLNNR